MASASYLSSPHSTCLVVSIRFICAASLEKLDLVFSDYVIVPMIFFEPDGFTSGSIGLYGNLSCSLWVCLSFCDA